MDVYETVIRRRSIRRFKNMAVPYDVLEKCINAARLAPTGRNRQLCEYVIVDDEQLLPRVFDCIPAWVERVRETGDPAPERRPKAYIIALVNSTLEAESGRRRMVTNYDAGLAAENIILVALEQGVGSCPLLSFDEKELSQILNIPDNYAITLVIALGYPDESPVLETSTGPTDIWTDSQGVRHVPKRRLEDILHRNKFL